jgi:hypothetical protein
MYILYPFYFLIFYLITSILCAGIVLILPRDDDYNLLVPVWLDRVLELYCLPLILILENLTKDAPLIGDAKRDQKFIEERQTSKII